MTTSTNASYRNTRHSKNQNISLKKEILSFELIDDVGFANLSKYHEIEGGSTPFDFLHNAKTGIVYIARIDKVIEKYGKWYVASLNNFLKQTNYKIVELLKSYGLYSVSILDEKLTKNLIGRISFRQLAVLAGLGTIGKNTCLLNPKHGANVLIGVVLTTAHLQHNTPLKLPVCSDCDICLKSCPVGAIAQNAFNRYKCKNRRKILGKSCGTPCIKHCSSLSTHHNSKLSD